MISAVVSVFLIWIYLSWVVVLLGAEIVYTLQYHQASKIEKPKPVEADVCDGYYALRVVMAVGERFLKGLEPISLSGGWQRD